LNEFLFNTTLLRHAAQQFWTKTLFPAIKSHKKSWKSKKKRGEKVFKDSREDPQIQRRFIMA
jgi:hypothetical protein